MKQYCIPEGYYVVEISNFIRMLRDLYDIIQTEYVISQSNKNTIGLLDLSPALYAWHV